MKTKNVKINKCARCGMESPFFIWTTSRQVNAGIRTMYRDDKICMKCYEELKSVYPNVERHGHMDKCPVCGSRDIKAHYRNITYDGDIFFNGELIKKDNSEHMDREVEHYCYVCGYIFEDEEE